MPAVLRRQSHTGRFQASRLLQALRRSSELGLQDKLGVTARQGLPREAPYVSRLEDCAEPVDQAHPRLHEPGQALRLDGRQLPGRHHRSDRESGAR